MDFKGECKCTGCFMRNADRKEKENKEKTQEHNWLLMNVMVVQNCAEDQWQEQVKTWHGEKENICKDLKGMCVYEQRRAFTVHGDGCTPQGNSATKVQERKWKRYQNPIETAKDVP